MQSKTRQRKQRWKKAKVAKMIQLSHVYECLSDAVKFDTKFDGWSTDTSFEKRIVFYKLRVGKHDTVTLEKAVAVKTDMTVAVTAWGKLVPQHAYAKAGTSGKLELVLQTVGDVKSLLRYVDSLNICVGCS